MPILITMGGGWSSVETGWDGVPKSEFNAMAPDGASIHAARVPLGIVGPDGSGRIFTLSP